MINNLKALQNISSEKYFQRMRTGTYLVSNKSLFSPRILAILGEGS